MNETTEKPIDLTFTELSQRYFEWKEHQEPSQRLLDLDQHQVRIRGFLYSTEEGKWLLAKEPNLKSCCVGSKHRIAEQIYVTGQFPQDSLQSAKTVQGDFFFTLNAPEFYGIKNGVVVEDGNFHTPYISFFAVVLAFAFLFLWYKKK